MSRGSPRPGATETSLRPPFAEALRLTPSGSGRFDAELIAAWEVGGGKQHGGLLLALTTKAGLAGLAEQTGAGPSDPLAVSAEFLHAPVLGPVRLETEVLKVGRTASVVRSVLRQDGRAMITATVTAGRLPSVSEDAPALWADLPPLAAEPPAGSRSTADVPGPVPPLASACEVMIDPATSAYLRRERADPVMRGWARPVGEEPDPLFAVFAGDILPPVLFNMGILGWVPTVQLTALVRARPEPGWLRLESCARAVVDGWLDEDMTVIDSAGNLVCQARQLALAPRRTR